MKANIKQIDYDTKAITNPSITKRIRIKSPLFSIEYENKIIGLINSKSESDVLLNIVKFVIRHWLFSSGIVSLVYLTVKHLLGL